MCYFDRNKRTEFIETWQKGYKVGYEFANSIGVLHGFKEDIPKGFVGVSDIPPTEDNRHGFHIFLHLKDAKTLCDGFIDSVVREVEFRGQCIFGSKRHEYLCREVEGVRASQVKPGKIVAHSSNRI